MFAESKCPSLFFLRRAAPYNLLCYEVCVRVLLTPCSEILRSAPMRRRTAPGLKSRITLPFSMEGESTDEFLGVFGTLPKLFPANLTPTISRCPPDFPETLERELE